MKCTHRQGGADFYVQPKPKTSKFPMTQPALDANRLAFPAKMYQIIEVEDSSVVQWELSGRLFRILDFERFQHEIIPKYFRRKAAIHFFLFIINFNAVFSDTNITSVRRQLNIYGFKFIHAGPYKGMFFHPLFRRGDFATVCSMARVGAPRNKYSAYASRSSEAILNSLIGSLPCGIAVAASASATLQEGDKKESPRSVADEQFCDPLPSGRPSMASTSLPVVSSPVLPGCICTDCLVKPSTSTSSTRVVAGVGDQVSTRAPERQRGAIDGSVCCDTDMDVDDYLVYSFEDLADLPPGPLPLFCSAKLSQSTKAAVAEVASHFK